jgi:3-deoxy-D-manno-octulosonic-acid transferase
MWILLYRILYLPAFLVALPYYGIRMLKRGGYGKDFAQRIGLFPKLSPKHPDRPRIWLQAVSVGEVLSVGALMRELKSQLNAEIILTTTTSTGYAEARKRYGQDCLEVGLFPLDFVVFNHRSWSRIDPDIIITMESELWPEHLHEAQRRKIPVYVVNARLSDSSFRRYQRIHYLAKRLLAKVSIYFPSSEVDRQRLIQLGVAGERIGCVGNIKMDVAPREVIAEELRQSLRNDLGFRTKEDGTEPLVLLGASTWPGEEALLLDLQRSCCGLSIDCRLLLVPRHAERRAEIIRLLSSQSQSYHVRSRDGNKAKNPFCIHLADTTGELSFLAQAADIAFIGKSLAPNQGGQTPIEAVSIGLPTVMGPHMENFRAIVDSLVKAGAVWQTDDKPSTETALLRLLSSERERQALTEAAKKWTLAQTGVSAKIAAEIASDFRCRLEYG